MRMRWIFIGIFARSQKSFDPITWNYFDYNKNSISIIKKGTDFL